MSETLNKQKTLCLRAHGMQPKPQRWYVGQRPALLPGAAEHCVSCGAACHLGLSCVVTGGRHQNPSCWTPFTEALAQIPCVGSTGCSCYEGRDLCIGACSRKESAVFSWLEACPQVNLLLFWSSAFSSFCVEEEVLSGDSSTNLFQAVQIIADKSMNTVISTAICLSNYRSINIYISPQQSVLLIQCIFPDCVF